MSTSWLLKSGLRAMTNSNSSHPLTSSSGPDPSVTTTSGQESLSSSSTNVLAETFERHWQQLREIAAHNVSHTSYTPHTTRRVGNQAYLVSRTPVFLTILILGKHCACGLNSLKFTTVCQFLKDEFPLQIYPTQFILQRLTHCMSFS